MEANIMLFKCGKMNKLFGVRIQKTESGDWVRTWAFKINDKKAASEGYDKTQIQGSLAATFDYPGCPYCETEGFFRCGKCGRFNCYHNEDIVTCSWCGNTGAITIADQFSIEGSGF